MKLRLAKRTAREIERKSKWWADNRPAAPTLFAEELKATLLRIAQAPNSGVPWPTAKRPNLQRVLMVETGNHIYFEIDERNNVVNVLALWGATRGRAPKL